MEERPKPQKLTNQQTDAQLLRKNATPVTRAHFLALLKYEVDLLTTVLQRMSESAFPNGVSGSVYPSFRLMFRRYVHPHGKEREKRTKKRKRLRYNENETGMLEPAKSHNAILKGPLRDCTNEKFLSTDVTVTRAHNS